MSKVQESDYIGKKFNKLTVTAFEYPPTGGRTYVICQCECGNVIKRYPFEIKLGRIKSCGCFVTKNGDSCKILPFTREKRLLCSIHHAMKSRCLNQNNKAYKHYGGRGILIEDPSWMDFEIFYVWCISNGWRKGLHLDRRDNNKGYGPDNCRFVTCKINIQNRRSTIRFTINGFTKPLSEWVKIFKLPYQVVHGRIKGGMSVIEALTIPKNPVGRQRIDYKASKLYI